MEVGVSGLGFRGLGAEIITNTVLGGFLLITLVCNTPKTLF